MADAVNSVMAAFATALGDFASAFASGAATLIPSLLPILAVIIAVGFGIRIIRKVTGR